MILFFGDSLTSGENNGFIGYVEKLKLLNYKNFGVSGTCIGDYSLYPVGDNNLIQLLYKHKSDIEVADKIFLEYGANDISALTAGYIDIKRVEIDLIKCLDFIKQTNNKAVIYFILLGVNDVKMSESQTTYLMNDYLKNVDININKQTWLNTYRKFVEFVLKVISNIIYMPYLLETDIDIDGIHPNDIGYEKIAYTLKEIVK